LLSGSQQFERSLKLCILPVLNQLLSFQNDIRLCTQIKQLLAQLHIYTLKLLSGIRNGIRAIKPAMLGAIPVDSRNTFILHLSLNYYKITIGPESNYNLVNKK